MSSKMDTDGKGYVRDDTIDTTLNKMLLGTDYHGEATAVASTYSSGTCQVALGAACKHLMFLVEVQMILFIVLWILVMQLVL